MELKLYFKIAWRWWWLILVPPLVVAVYGLATYQTPAGGYALSLRYTAGQPETVAASPNYDPNYYRWLTSEYIVSGLKDWAQTGQFVAAVQAQIAASGSSMPPASIAGADNARSILLIYLATSISDPQVANEQLRLTAEAVTAVLQNQNAEVFPQLGGQAATVTPLDNPSPAPTAPSLRARLDLPIKVAIGLALGLALAFLAHYFDPLVRDRNDVEQMGLKIVAEMPQLQGGRKKEEA
jgi:hypothetical protein